MKPLIYIQVFVQYCRNARKHAFVCFIDYDRVQYDKAIAILRQFNIDRKDNFLYK